MHRYVDKWSKHIKSVPFVYKIFVIILSENVGLTLSKSNSMLYSQRHTI